jgi:3-hydroxyisobutyrate dehydrogenase
MQTVALMGLGTMGNGMAGRLLAAGFPLTVWNRNPARAHPLADAGAKIASTPRDAASGADVVVSMVADDEASHAVWMAESGALAGAKPGAVLIESSTVSPEHVETLAAAATQRRCDFLDAPVTGSRIHAASGELLFLVGGDRAVLERVRAVFDAMGRDVVHVGPHASGARLKLINNFLCGVQAVALAEAMALIEKSGLDRSKALAVLTDGTAGSPLVKTVASRMVARDYTVNFALALMTKDVIYAQRDAARLRIVLGTAAAAERAFHQAIDAGHGGQDFAAVVEPLRSGS